MRYRIWPKGDTGLHTCRVYATLADASEAARSAAAFHGRAYEVRRGTETILTVTPPRKGGRGMSGEPEARRRPGTASTPSPRTRENPPASKGTTR